jgi:cation diffusion facilitator family transporter
MSDDDTKTSTVADTHGGHDHPHGDRAGHGHAHGDHGHLHGHDRDHDHPKRLRGAIKEIFAPHSHDVADSVDNELESSAAGIRAVKISLLVLGLTAVAQIVIVIISGSIALAADTIHNFSDALTAVPLWIAFALSTKAATRRYTYGFGRVEDLAGLFVVAMITLSAIIAGYEAIMRLIHPQPIEHVAWVALAGLLGFIGNELVALYRIRVGRRIGSAALVADGLHARTDGFTSLAVLVGAGGVALGFPLADPIIGLVITVAILAVLRAAVRDVFRRLIDGVDPKFIDTAEAALAGQQGVRSVHSVRMRWIGHRLHADAELDIDPALSLAEAHRIAHHAEHDLIHAVPKLTTAIIHAYPADDVNPAEQHRQGTTAHPRWGPKFATTTNPLRRDQMTRSTDEAASFSQAERISWLGRFG